VVTKELLQKEDPLNQNIQLFSIDFFFSDFTNNPESRDYHLKPGSNLKPYSLPPPTTRAKKLSRADSALKDDIASQTCVLQLLSGG
jgi:hypothetical protein